MCQKYGVSVPYSGSPHFYFLGVSGKVNEQCLRKTGRRQSKEYAQIRENFLVLPSENHVCFVSGFL